MKAIESFEAAIQRSNHFLLLYDVLKDTRQRKVRSDWASKFKRLMQWPDADEIVRVDGKDCKSILILRQELGLSRKSFTHDYLSELLRAAIVATVSALDRYMHDQIVQKSWGILNRKSEDIPKEFKRLNIPVVETKRALARLKKDSTARPGHIVKQAIQSSLHNNITFQGSNSLLVAARMLGIKKFWTKVAKKMPGNSKGEGVINKLNKIAHRRNQIVHEADLIRKITTKKLTLREIKHNETNDAIQWIHNLVKAIDTIIVSEKL